MTVCAFYNRARTADRPQRAAVYEPCSQPNSTSGESGVILLVTSQVLSPSTNRLSMMLSLKTPSTVGNGSNPIRPHSTRPLTIYGTTAVAADVGTSSLVKYSQHPLLEAKLTSKEDTHFQTIFQTKLRMLGQLKEFNLLVVFGRLEDKFGLPNFKVTNRSCCYLCTVWYKMVF